MHELLAQADAARVTLNENASQAVPQGDLYCIKRTFRNGDLITLELSLRPRLETGYRGSASIYVGAQLMSLALPDEASAWRYAVMPGHPLTAAEENGEAHALVAACDAPMWGEKGGFILPPPQGVPMAAAYELTLIPFAGGKGRVAAFPCVRER